MTTYAYDSSTTTMLAIWEAGLGPTARVITRLHPRTPERHGLRLAQALTGLSTAAWLSYSDPGLVDIGYVDIDAPATLRALRRPHLPRAGLLYREGEAVLECANGVGRELVEIGSGGWCARWSPTSPRNWRRSRRRPGVISPAAPGRPWR